MRFHKWILAAILTFCYAASVKAQKIEIVDSDVTTFPSSLPRC